MDDQKKEPSTTVTVLRGGTAIALTYSFKDSMDAIVWRSYIDKDFFYQLVEASKGSDDTLKRFLDDSGFTEDVKIGPLKASLSRNLGNFTAQQLMEKLHDYTDPKLFINSSWVQW